ncbi:MAG: helix-turn-helix domain-containing protein [Mogibacterium sp.]|nr:helix-turn-helix domain-containing protein [Mogibacterium sp.]
MSIGENIRKLREGRILEDGSRLTQEKLAERLGVSFQAVSSWERDEYIPETKKLIDLAKELDASVDAILNDRKMEFKTNKTLYDWEHMKTYVKTTAAHLNMTNTLKALDYAVTKHAGVTRKNSEIPYIYHPLNMACHALSMGINEDEIIAAILLHDVVEDIEGVTFDDLPVNEEARELVRLMTKDKSKGSHDPEMLDKYYAGLASNPKAALIKCIDKCNNMTTMSWGLSRKSKFQQIEEVDKYFPKLLKVVKDTPEYNNAAWLLKYQIESMLDIYKRLV